MPFLDRKKDDETAKVRWGGSKNKYMFSARAVKFGNETP